MAGKLVDSHSRHVCLTVLSFIHQGVAENQRCIINGAALYGPASAFNAHC